MKYRVKFTVGTVPYFTEWFDTLEEASIFVRIALYAGMDVRWIEDENEEII